MAATLPERLQRRAGILRSLRAFLDARGYVEVTTPVRIPAPAQEEHIDAEPSGAAFLRTSPELHMKRLLAAGCPRIYQLGPCFRQGEWGHRHRPEFTMLEWYCAGADYLDILAETEELIRHVAGTLAIRYQGAEIRLAAPWPRITVSAAFQRWAGWDPVATFDADRFDLDLVDQVEPNLPADTPAVLLDYPAAAAALARRKPANPAVAERWEVYLGGLELANAFSELTDVAEQETRFAAAAELRAAAGRPVYPPDTVFLAALRQGLPSCAGVALGVDRLVMLLTDCADIADTLALDD